MILQMKLFFDTEFTGLQKDTTLISLGIISEDGHCFYAKFTDYDKNQVNDWIEENVLNNLKLHKKLLKLFDVQEVKGTKEEIKEALLDWLGTLDANKFELISDVCHYDMVLFIDIFGGAFDLPEFISPACYDINQDIYYMKNSMFNAFDTNREKLLKTLVDGTVDEVFYNVMPILELPEKCKHNALYDAIIKCLYERLNDFDKALDFYF